MIRRCIIIFCRRLFGRTARRDIRQNFCILNINYIRMSIGIMPANCRCPKLTFTVQLPRTSNRRPCFRRRQCASVDYKLIPLHITLHKAKQCFAFCRCVAAYVHREFDRLIRIFRTKINRTQFLIVISTIRTNVLQNVIPAFHLIFRRDICQNLRVSNINRVRGSNVIMPTNCRRYQLPIFIQRPGAGNRAPRFRRRKFFSVDYKLIPSTVTIRKSKQCLTFRRCRTAYFHRKFNRLVCVFCTKVNRRHQRMVIFPFGTKEI